MADFYPAAQQIQNPDILGSYIRGQMAPLQVQQAQQQVTAGNLNIDQLKLALKGQQMTQDLASQLYSPSGQSAGAQNPGGQSGGIQNGPQSGVSSQAPQQSSGSYDGSFGGSPRVNTMMALDVLQGRDPLKTAQGAQEYEQKQRQLQAQGPLALMDTVAASASPAKIVMNNPGMIQRWQQLAPQLGFDPVKDFNDDNVRTAINFARNQVAGSAGLPTKELPQKMQDVQGPLGSLYQRGTIDNKLTQVKGEEPLKDVIGGNGQPTNMRASQAEGKQPFNQVTYGSAQMAGGPGALLAALATKGVSLPVGLRSQQQQIATLNGLIAANPGKSPDEIANLVRTGQLDFNGAKRSTGQLSGVLAAANAQSSKLEKDFAQMEPLIAQLPNAPNVINRAFVGLKNDLAFGGDKDSAKLVLYMREAATEYAKLSSGSTGAAAPAEGNIKDAVEIFHKAFTEGGYQGLKEAMLQSAQNKRDAYREGLQTAASPGFATGQSSPSGAHPPAVQSLLDKYK